MMTDDLKDRGSTDAVPYDVGVLAYPVIVQYYMEHYQFTSLSTSCFTSPYCRYCSCSLHSVIWKEDKEPQTDWSESSFLRINVSKTKDMDIGDHSGFLEIRLMVISEKDPFL